jgi:ribosome biogenesis GTPase
LEELFPEFSGLKEDCRFKGCLHINEPECAVKDKVGQFVSEERYSFYKETHLEILNKR